jgi:hypothetical protein
MPPTILKRNLEFHFPRAVSAVGQLPQTLEVVVVPLSDPSGPDQGTYVGGLQRQTVLLDDDDNVLVFSLVPTASPQLLAPVRYRVAWRDGGVVGRTYTYDFAMPDADTRFDELGDLGQIIGGEAYLQQTDLGVPGRVARLNSSGIPITSTGVALATSASVTSLSTSLTAETTARTSGDTNTLATANAYTNQQTSALSSTLTASQSALSTSLNTAITNESAARATAVAAEITARTAADTALGYRIDALDATITGDTSTLDNKADLDASGRVPISQIPREAITSAVSVANQAEMLALTTEQVQPGDLAVRPDGVYGLFSTNPAVLSNWVPLSKISSVNGYQGEINLTAADVGAIPIGSSIPVSQVIGLQTALDAKASTTQLSSLTTTVNALQNDSTVVRTVSGTIPPTLLGTTVAYIDGSNNVVNKAGTIIAAGTGNVASVNGLTGAITLTATNVGAIATGSALPISQITGLQTALDAKVGTSDSRLTNSRTPTAHAASHASGGSDALTLAVTQITGLQTALDAKTAATATTALTNRVSTLETQVTNLTSGGGGSPVSKDVWWDSASIVSGQTTAPAFKTAGVRLKSPFGKAASGQFYIDPAGAAENETLWPYITPMGHLELRKWDETAGADVVYAPQAALDATNTTVNLKASKVDLALVDTAVRAKANQADLEAMQAALAAKATVISVNALSTAITGLATQASVNALTTTVTNKASTAEVNTLTTTVATKASQAELDTAKAAIVTLNTALTNKADLITVGVDKKIPLAQIPIGIPVSSVNGLTEALVAKASLVSGKILVDQIPTLPISQITDLQTTLDGKASLVNGKLASSQIPAIATHETFAVASRAAMMGLSSSQVQIGDQCIITSGTDAGTYTLIASDPSQFGNWLYNTVRGTVSSVNTQTGAVNLTADNVNAWSKDSLIPIASINGLTGRLDGLATTSALTTGLADKQSAEGVRSIISGSPQIKQAADYVATTAVGTLSGAQTIDGVSTVPGKVVLLTAQVDPIANGVYVTGTSAWTRATDMSTGSYLVRGTIVNVTGGSVFANTVWQVTSASGVVGTNVTNWVKVLQSGTGGAYTAGNGVALTAGAFSAKPDRGITVGPSGIATNPAVVAHKFIGDIPGGSTVCSVNHGLNTQWPLVQVISVASGAAVLVGWTVTGPNTVSFEFATTPQSGQWKVVVLG